MLLSPLKGGKNKVCCLKCASVRIEDSSWLKFVAIPETWRADYPIFLILSKTQVLISLFYERGVFSKNLRCSPLIAKVKHECGIKQSQSWPIHVAYVDKIEKKHTQTWASVSCLDRSLPLASNICHMSPAGRWGSTPRKTSALSPSDWMLATCQFIQGRMQQRDNSDIYVECCASESLPTLRKTVLYKATRKKRKLKVSQNGKETRGVVGVFRLHLCTARAK